MGTATCDGGPQLLGAPAWDHHSPRQASPRLRPLDGSARSRIPGFVPPATRAAHLLWGRAHRATPGGREIVALVRSEAQDLHHPLRLARIDRSADRRSVAADPRRGGPGHRCLDRDRDQVPQVAPRAATPHDDYGSPLLRRAPRPLLSSPASINVLPVGRRDPSEVPTGQ